MPGQNRTVGGLAHTALKNENGARFDSPLSSTVETQPIGRGRMEPIMILYSDRHGNSSVLASINARPLIRSNNLPYLRPDHQRCD
jgi:hypothetical protein